jgi:hypothetical protein
MTTRSSPRPVTVGSKFSSIGLANTPNPQPARKKPSAADPREKSLDLASASLVQSLRHSLALHNRMLSRVLMTTSQPSPVIVELLEDVGNRYLDLSELALHPFKPTAKRKRKALQM